MDTSTIEQATIGQSENPLWHKIRRNKITASKVGPIVKRKIITPKFVKDTLRPKNIFFLPAIRWGLENEAAAIKAYSSHSKNFVKPCGIFISPLQSWLGATPDGVVYDPHEKSTGLLEIKCPFSIRMKKPKDCFENMSCTDREGKLKQNHNYYYQIQTQLYATGYKWCDFVIYTPVGLHIQRVPFNETYYTEKVIPKLEGFYKDHFEPAIRSEIDQTQTKEIPTTEIQTTDISTTEIQTTEIPSIIMK